MGCNAKERLRAMFCTANERITFAGRADVLIVYRQL